MPTIEPAVAGRPPPAQFTITTVCDGPRRGWLGATGELDLAAADELRAMLEQQCEAGHCFTRLDLSQVTFLDCACLGVLVHAHHHFLATHGTLTLTGVGPLIRRLIMLTGLDQTLFTAATPTGPPGSVADRRGTAVGTRRVLSAGTGRQPAQRTRTGLTDRVVVEQALGVLMSRRYCTRAQAAGWLSERSEARERTLVEVAQSILADDDVADGVPPRPGQAGATTASRRAGDQ